MDSESKLKKLCEKLSEAGPYLRPFAPNSNWKESKVFIVGTNPATPLRDSFGEFNDFNDYWTSLTIDNDRFNKIYRTKYSKGNSKTTNRLKLLAPLKPLILNAIIYPSPRIKEIPDIQLQRDIGKQCFEELINICQPKVILFHGKEANDLCFRYFGIESRDFDIATGLYNYSPIGKQIAIHEDIRLFGCPHLSGLGVPKGYKVSEMDNELKRFSEIVKAIF